LVEKGLNKIIRKLPWLLLAIIGLALFLRLYGLGDESLKADETFSVLWSVQDPVSIIKSTALIEHHPPFYYLCLHYWMILFGEGESAIRVLSALLGIMSVVVLYKVGRELFNRNIAITASFLMAINAFVITHTQEARQYGFLLLLTLVSFLYFIRIIQAEKIKNSHVIIYVIANILLCYTHIFGPFTIVCQALYFLLFRRRYSEVRFIFWGSQAVILLFFLPWIYVLFTYTFPHIADPDIFYVMPEITVIWVAEIVASISGPQYLWPPVAFVFVLIFLTLCLAGVFLSPRLIEKKRLKETVTGSKLAIILKSIAEPRTALLLIWLVIPVVISLIVSLTYASIFINRYLIGITPALYLLAAFGIYRVHSVINNYAPQIRVSCILIVLITAISIQGLYTYYALPQKPEWREITNLVKQDYRPDDGIVFNEVFYSRPFYYYFLENPEIDTKTLRIIGTEPSWTGKERVWLIFAYASRKSDVDYSLMNELVSQYGSGTQIVQEKYHLITANVYLFD